MATTSKATRARQQKAAAGRPPARKAVPIPGGFAEFYLEVELTPRRQRAVSVVGLQIFPRLRELAKASAVTIDGRTVDESAVFDGAVVGLTGAEAALLLDLTDVAAWAYLKAWTLTDDDGQPRPLPMSQDDVLDLEAPLYKALTEHVAKLLTDTTTAGGFTRDELPDNPDDADPSTPS